MEHGYVIFTKKNGDSTPIPVKDDVLVGRALDCGIRIHNNTVSQQHCLILVRRGEKACLRNLSSSYLTSVNGVSIGNQDYKLHHGDRVDVGKRSFLWMYPRGTTFYKEQRVQAKLRRKSEADCKVTTVDPRYHKRRTLDPRIVLATQNKSAVKNKTVNAVKVSTKKKGLKIDSPSLELKSPKVLESRRSLSELETPKFPTPQRVRLSVRRASVTKSPKESKSPATRNRVRKRSLSSPAAIPSKRQRTDSPSVGKNIEGKPVISTHVVHKGATSSILKKKTPSVSVRKLSAWGVVDSTKKRPLFSEVLKKKAVQRANAANKASKALKIIPRKGAAKKKAVVTPEIPKAFRFNSTGHANSPEPIFVGLKALRTPVQALINGGAHYVKKFSMKTDSPSALPRGSPVKSPVRLSRSSNRSNSIKYQLQSPSPRAKPLVETPIKLLLESPSAKSPVQLSSPSSTRSNSIKSPLQSPSPRAKSPVKTPQTATQAPAESSLRMSSRSSARSKSMKSPVQSPVPRAKTLLKTPQTTTNTPSKSLLSSPSPKSSVKYSSRSSTRSNSIKSPAQSPVPRAKSLVKTPQTTTNTPGKLLLSSPSPKSSVKLSSRSSTRSNSIKSPVQSPVPRTKSLVKTPQTTTNTPGKSLLSSPSPKSSVKLSSRSSTRSNSIKSPVQSPSSNAKLLVMSPSPRSAKKTPSPLAKSLQLSSRKTSVHSPASYHSPQGAEKVLVKSPVSSPPPVSKTPVTSVSQSSRSTPAKSYLRTLTRHSTKKCSHRSSLALQRLSPVSGRRETKSSSPRSLSHGLKYTTMLNTPSQRAALVALAAVDSLENPSCISSPFTSTPSVVNKRVSCVSTLDSSRLDTPLSILTGHSSVAHSPASGRKSRMDMVSRNALNTSISSQPSPVKSSLKDSPSKSDSCAKSLSVSFNENVDMQTFGPQSEVRRSTQMLCSPFTPGSNTSSHYIGSPDLESTTFDFNGAKTPNVPREMFVSSILSSGSSFSGQTLGSAKRKGKSVKSPFNCLDNLSGVRQLMKSPAVSGGYVDVKGVKRLLALPQKSPSYLAVEGVNRLFKRQFESLPKNSLNEVAGLHELFASQSPSRLRELFSSQSPSSGSPVKSAPKISPNRSTRMLESCSASPVAKIQSEVEWKENLNSSPHSAHRSMKAAPRKVTPMNDEPLTQAPSPDKDSPLRKQSPKTTTSVETSPQKTTPVRQTRRGRVVRIEPSMKPISQKKSSNDMSLSPGGGKPLRRTRRGVPQKAVSPVKSPQSMKQESATKEPTPDKAGPARRTRRNASKKQTTPKKIESPLKVSPVEVGSSKRGTATAKGKGKRKVHFEEEEEEVTQTKVATRGKRKVEEQAVESSPVKKSRHDEESPVPLKKPNPKKTSKTKRKGDAICGIKEDSPPPTKRTRAVRGAGRQTDEGSNPIATENKNRSVRKIVESSELSPASKSSRSRSPAAAPPSPAKTRGGRKRAVEKAPSPRVVSPRKTRSRKK